MKIFISSIFFYMLLVSSLFSQEIKSDDVGIKKVVYNLTSSKINRIKTNLLSGIVAHTNYYNNKLQELKVKVIIHGGAYKFFMKDLNNTAYAFEPELVKQKLDLEKRLDSLAKQYGVEFYVCEVGVYKRKLNPKSFYPFVSMIKNASIGLIDAQSEGYSYLPLH